MRCVVFKVLLFTVAPLLLSSCASGASPRLLNGRYYMGGDAQCLGYRILSPTRIMCLDKSGRDMGYRDAIPHETMQIYVQQQAARRQSMAELTAQLQATNEALERQNAETRARVNSWTPPAVQPIGPQKSTTRCLVNGIYVSCNTSTSPW